MKKSVPLLFIILTIMFLTSNVICSGLLLYREKSENGKYKLNVVTSMKYKTEIFGDPFGDFLVDAEDGWMVNEQGVKGEYKYLGYNYKEEKSPMTDTSASLVNEERYLTRIIQM